MRHIFTIALVLFTLVIITVVKAESFVNDETIKQAIIQQSISGYSGNCPCPYNVDRAGRSCGRRSAYSKPGGYSPICYPQDITPTMIEQYRNQNNIK